VKTFALKLSKALSLASLVACSTNMYEATENTDPATTAAVQLEQKRPSAAIKTLESALAKDQGNPKYLSLLSAAYAQRAGVEPLSVAQAMASKNSGSSLTYTLLSTNTSLIALFDVMPEATTDTVADIQNAVSILTSDLPRADWLPGDSFKFAIYQTASMVMGLKILDSDQDGKLSTAELLGISGGTGTSLISQLEAAAAILGASGESSAAVQVATILESQKSAIDAMDGATDEEKLRNYLAKSSSGSSGSTGTSTSSVSSALSNRLVEAGSE
jgi:hypothetical protein